MKFTILLTPLFAITIACSNPKQSEPVQDQNADPSVWLIENRKVPQPSSTSEIFYNSILETPQPNTDLEEPIPQNAAEWKAIQNNRDSERGAGIAKFAEESRVKIEEMVIESIIARKASPEKIDEDFNKAIFVHLHGGAYTFSAGMAGMYEAILLANYLQIPVISVDYRMPPDHPFPAALADAVLVYEQLLKKYPDHQFYLGGTSAGGGLSMATVLKLKDENIPLPSAIFAGTPWTDLSKTGDSYYIFEGIDRILVQYEGVLEESALLYADGKDLKDPYLSPVYGDLSNFPPTFLLSGTRDMFLSNTVRADRKLKDAGVDTELVVLEGQSHADYLVVPNAPESIAAFQDLKEFLIRYREN